MSRKYKCSTCAQGFKTNSSLNVHTRIHSNERAFKCEICSKAFIRRYEVKQHLPTHFKSYGLTNFEILSTPLNVLCLQYKPIVKSKEFTCSTCSKVFKRKPQLTRHMISHSFIYKYCCGICTKSFKTLQELRKHFLRYHNEHYNDYKDYSYEDETNFAPAVYGKKFQCDICSKHFTTRESIKVHMLIHRNLKPFTCEVCSKGYRVRFRLKKHLRTHSENVCTLDEVKKEEDTDRLDSYEYEQKSENVFDPRLFKCRVVLTRCEISIIVKEERTF